MHAQRKHWIFQGIFGLVIGAVLTSSPAHAQSVMTKHMREVVRTGQVQPTGRLSPNINMRLDVVLPVRDLQAVKNLVRDTYDPASPNYRHFLTPHEFTQRFGPSQQDYDTVVRFLRDGGFTVVGGTLDGRIVQIRGPVSAVESAFNVRMQTYQHPTENRTFYAPDREPTTSLPFQLWSIGGLDNFSIPKSAHSRRASGNAIPAAGLGSGQSGSFLGSDMRAAYYGGTSLTGAGQVVGLLEFTGYNINDINTYYTVANQTPPSPSIIDPYYGVSSATCLFSQGCDNSEATLDITQVLGMAPGLDQLVVYIGENSSDSTTSLMLSAVTSGTPRPTVVSCSWFWEPSDPTILDPYFLQMAAQGQTFVQASGDWMAWSPRPGLVYPADDPYVLTVGGTSLTTMTKGGPYQSELAWVNQDGSCNLVSGCYVNKQTYPYKQPYPAGSGGGWSLSPDQFAIPSWQQPLGGINGSSQLYRNGPDVSANADYTFLLCANQSPCIPDEGGTSAAAPMWAGYIALLNEQLVSMDQSPIGFLNPLIYSRNIASGLTFSLDFNDITTNETCSFALCNQNQISAASGYDLVTGWGSPKPCFHSKTGEATPCLITDLAAFVSSVGSATGVGVTAMNNDSLPYAYTISRSNELWLANLSSSNGVFHYTWTNLGNPLGDCGGGYCTANISQPVGVTLANNIPYTFVVAGKDSSLWLNSWNGATWIWQGLGEPRNSTNTGSVAISGSIGVVTLDSAYPSAFVTGFDPTSGATNLYADSWTGTAWEWTNLGSPSTPQGHTTIGSAVGVLNYYQRPWVYVVGDDGNLWVKYYTGSAWVWSNQGQPQGRRVAKGVGVTEVKASNGFEYPYCFVIGADGNLYLNYYNPGTGWVWVPLGNIGGIRSGVGVVTLSNGAPYAFVIGNDGNLYVYAGTPAPLWTLLKKPPNVAVSIIGSVGEVAINGDGYPYTFLIGSDGNLWVNYWTGSAWAWSNQRKLYQ